MTGRSPSGRACGPSDLSRDASQPEALVPNAEVRDPFTRRIKRCQTRTEKDALAHALHASYRVHWAAHEILTLDKQVIQMTLSGIRRGLPRLRMLRAFKRDADRIAMLAGMMAEYAAQGIEARSATTENTGVVHESPVPKGCAQTQSSTPPHSDNKEQG